MRLAALGAFPFPAPLGSQRFAAEQADALRAAGAEVELLAYGPGPVRRLDPRKLADDRAHPREHDGEADGRDAPRRHPGSSTTLYSSSSQSQ